MAKPNKEDPAHIPKHEVKSKILMMKHNMFYVFNFKSDLSWTKHVKSQTHEENQDQIIFFTGDSITNVPLGLKRELRDTLHNSSRVAVNIVTLSLVGDAPSFCFFW